MHAIPLDFSRFGLVAGAKIVCFGATSTLPAGLGIEICSLKIEHVSPESLVHQEICRRTPLGQQATKARQHGAAVPDQTCSQFCESGSGRANPKRDSSLGFPATLLHARVFDDWLDAREEVLAGCLSIESEAGSSLRGVRSGGHRTLSHAGSSFGAQFLRFELA